MDLTARAFWFAALLAAITVKPVAAQLGDEIPGPAYFLSVQALYSGEYQDVERALRRETGRGVRAGQTQWIDAICHYAMLGEVLYQQGRNAEALASFDQACQVFLSYPDWLLQVNFQQALRPDTNRARRVPPWGQSERNFVLGQFSKAEPVMVGEIGSAARAIRQGGVVQQPMLWRVNVAEVVRATALAIRRRNELLGPLAQHDAISRDLSGKLARGNLARANHWSGAWIDLLRGIAQEGLGKFNEADVLLERSLVVEGRFDHPLTCVAFMEQGRMAMLSGDHRRAAKLLAEAGFSAFYFEDWDVLTESMQLGWLNHIASNSPGIYPPLGSAATWAQANRLHHVGTKLRLAEAESLLWMGQLDAASALVEDAARRIGEMRTGLPGVHLLYVQAAAQMLSGKVGPGTDLLTRALAAQANVSVRNFQIARTNEMYDSRMVAPRVAVDVLGSLLADPTPADWVLQPLDAMAVLATPHAASFDRWFIAALERKEPAMALEIAEKAKRRKYLSAQPLGGRIAALRLLLEAPEGVLSREGVLQRQQILAAFPTYAALGNASKSTVKQLRTGAIFGASPDETKAISSQFAAWKDNVEKRQLLLAQMAVRRLPSSLEFPPLRSAEELKTSVADGEALVIFHSVGGGLYGFLISSKDTVLWPVRDPRRLRTDVSSLLQEIGNYGPTKQLSVTELESDKWRDLSAKLFASLFADSRLDLSKTKSLVIVPDDVLWYLPFEALVPDAAKPDAVLADQVLVRYAPTAALATSSDLPLRRPQRTGIVASRQGNEKDVIPNEEMLDEFGNVVSGPVRLPSPLPHPPQYVAQLLDGLVSFDDIESGGTSAASWLPATRSSRGDAGNDWFGLPYGGPERIVLSGLATASEQGLKGVSRRGSGRGPRPGDEIFQMLCGAMADGARTILISRWRTGGQMNFELVREFVREWPNAPANEAWQRACLLARETQLDFTREPRLKRPKELGEPSTADHPFFWAGYLLADNSPRAAKAGEEADAGIDADAAPEAGAPTAVGEPMPTPGIDGGSESAVLPAAESGDSVRKSGAEPVDEER